MKKIVLVIPILVLVIAFASCKQSSKPQQPADDIVISDNANSDIGIPSSASGSISEKMRNDIKKNAEKRGSDDAEESAIRDVDDSGE